MLVGVVSPAPAAPLFAALLKLFELGLLCSFLADPSGSAESGVTGLGVLSDPFEDVADDTPVVKAEVGVEVLEVFELELSLPTNQDGVQPLSPVLSLIT